MATRVQKRLGRLGWKLTILLGWFMVAGALGAAAAGLLLYSQLQEITPLVLRLAGGAAVGLITGTILIRGARLTDTAIVCSDCGARLREDTRLCPGCQTVLE